MTSEVKFTLNNKYSIFTVAFVNFSYPVKLLCYLTRQQHFTTLNVCNSVYFLDVVVIVLLSGCLLQLIQKVHETIQCYMKLSINSYIKIFKIPCTYRDYLLPKYVFQAIVWNIYSYRILTLLVMLEISKLFHYCKI